MKHTSQQQQEQPPPAMTVPRLDPGALTGNSKIPHPDTLGEDANEGVLKRAATRSMLGGSNH